MNENDMPPLAPRLLTPQRLARLEAVANSRLRDLVLVFESIVDPHNVGAALRSAEAFGVGEAFFVSPEPKAIGKESSSAARRWVTVHFSKALAPLAQQLRDRGFSLVGTVPSAPGIQSFRDLEPPAKLALLMGGEHEGLSEEATALCDHLITIPTVGFTESLNLSTAASILLEHFTHLWRQRGERALLPVKERRALFRTWCEREVAGRLRGKQPPPVAP